MKDNPTKDFLEEYARTVLEKNMEDLYACGGGYFKIFNLDSSFVGLVNLKPNVLQPFILWNCLA